MPVVTRMKASSSKALHFAVDFDDVVEALNVAFEDGVANHRQGTQRQFNAGDSAAARSFQQSLTAHAPRCVRQLPANDVELVISCAVQD